MDNTATFRIYQIKPGTELERYRFLNYEYMKNHSLWIEQGSYEKCFEGPLEDRTLDSIFEEFNTQRPEGFTGHSLSVSDVISIEKDDAEQVFYVDSIGFVELKGFFSSTDMSWIETDPDCSQYGRRISKEDLKYEFVQVNKLFDEKYFISQAMVDVREYDLDEILDILHAYGHDSLEDFADSYGGSFEWRLIAEMIFESEALQNCMEGPFSYERAEEKIKNIVAEKE